MLHLQEDVMTQEKALEALRQLAAEGLDAERIRQEYPQAYAAISSAFGSFWMACEAAGLVEALRPPVPANPDQPTLVAMIREYNRRNRLGRVILDRRLSAAIFRKFREQLPEALEAAGVPEPGLFMGSFTKQQLDEFLRHWAQEEKGVVVVKELTDKAKLGIRHHYGSLEAAGVALGIRFEGDDSDLPEPKEWVRPPRKPSGYWTKERALAKLKELAAQGYDLSHASTERPSLYAGISGAFGSFKAACEAAGIPYQPQARGPLNLTKYDLVRMIREHYERGTLGRFVLDEVLVAACNRKFAKHLTGALEEAGVPESEICKRSFTEEQIRKLLQQWAKAENGKVEVGQLIPKARMAIRRYYGTLAAASQALGIEFEGDDDELPEAKPRGRASWKTQPPKKEKPQKPPTRRPPGYWTDERIIEETRRRLSDEENPFSLTNKDDRALYAAATQHLGSFEEAARRAGVVYVPKRRRRPKETRSREEIAKAELSLAEFVIAERAKDGAVNLAELPPQVESILLLKFGGLQEAANALNLKITSMDGRTYVPEA